MDEMNEGDLVARTLNGQEGRVISKVRPGDTMAHVRFGNASCNVPLSQLRLAAVKKWPPADIETKELEETG